MKRGAAPWLAFLLLAASAAPLAEAAAPRCALPSDASPRTLRWEYALALDAADHGLVHVEVRLQGMRCAITEFSFATSTASGEAANVSSVPGVDTPLRLSDGGFSFEVDSDEEAFAYDMRVTEPAFRPGEYLAYAGPDFALFKAESLQLTFRYSYYDAVPFVNETTVRFDLPAGWRSAAPWERIGADAYRLADDSVQPRGYVVAGRILHEESRAVGGKTLQYVRLGEPGAYEDGMWSYIEKATPYYGAVYGDGVGDRVLLVNAPDPMFRGGLGGTDSFFVHERVDLRTVAHEYAHVYQLFATIETPPGSSLWLHEGDAEYHSALSLAAAGVWTPSEVDLFLDEAQRDRRDAALAAARLPDAGYGNDLERFAYRKGSVVLRALDETLRRDTDGEVGLPHVLQRLNARHAPDARSADDARVTNDDVRRAAEDVAQLDLSAFFERFVLGPEWPVITPYVPDDQFALSAIRFDPPGARPGEGVTASVDVTNLGTRNLTRTIEFQLGGETLARRQVALGVGARTTLDFGFLAPEPGAHNVSIGYQRATFRSLTPPDINIQHVSFSPSTLRAGSSASLLVFLENRGEQAGTARVEAYSGDRVLGRTTETILEGREVRTVPVPFEPGAEGQHPLRVVLHTPQGERTLEQTLAVEAADADLDGVPDHSDAFPSNPRRSRGGAGALGEAAHVPGPGALVVVALALSVAAARRRSGGRQ